MGAEDDGTTSKVDGSRRTDGATTRCVDRSLAIFAGRRGLSVSDVIARGLRSGGTTAEPPEVCRLAEAS